MNDQFSSIDLIVSASYLCIMIGLGIWLSRSGKQDTSQDYFLAGNSKPRENEAF